MKSAPIESGGVLPSDLSRQLVLPALLLCTLAKCWLSWGRYIGQDEFESIHQGWLIFQGAVPYRDFNSNHPPLGFAVIGAINLLTDNPVWVVRLARLLVLTLSGVSLFFVYRISRDVFNARAARWTVIVLALNATFWEWSTEVRTDSLMLPFWLAAVSLLFSPRPRSINRRMVLIGLLMGAAFWVNQKVVLHAVPIGIFMLAGGPEREWKLRQVVLAVGASLVPALCVLGYAATKGSLVALFEHNFSGSCAWGLFETNVYAAWRAVTLKHTVLRDVGFVLLGQAAVCWGRRRTNSRAEYFVLTGALWMLCTLFITPAPFQYYTLSVFPLFAVLIGGYLDEFIGHMPDRLPNNADRRALVLPLAMVCFAAFPLVRMSKFVRPTNSYQFEVLRVANSLLKDGQRGFDGSGTIVNRPDAYPFHWILWQPEIELYTQGELPPLIPTLREYDCKWVIDTCRVRSLPESERKALQRNFVRVWGPIRLAGYDSIAKINDTPRQFDLWYDGVYEANRSNVLIDGEVMDELRTLSAGTHTVSLTQGAGRVTLHNVSEMQDVELPVEHTDPGYFLNFYGFLY